MAGTAGAIGNSILADKFKKNTKGVVKTTAVCSTIAFTILACVQEKYIVVAQENVAGENVPLEWPGIPGSVAEGYSFPSHQTVCPGIPIEHAHCLTSLINTMGLSACTH